MVLWNVRSKRSLAGIWEPGGRTLEEEKEKDGWGRAQSEGQASSLRVHVGRGSRPYIVAAHPSVLIASRPVGFARVWYFPQTTPLWISCWRGSWQNRSCCAELPSLESQEGGKPGSGLRLGSRIPSVHYSPLPGSEDVWQRYPWSREDSPSTEKGHCSALRLKAEPETTNWFDGSEVTRSPVLPEFGAGNARAIRFPLPASANWHWQAVVEPLAANWKR